MSLETGYEVRTEVPLEQQPGVVRPTWRLLAGLEDMRTRALEIVPDLVDTGPFLDMQRTRESVYKRMFQSPSKGMGYRLFVTGIQLFRYAPFIPNPALKGELLESFYLAMRILDDVVDGDAPNKLDPKERIRFVQEVLQAIESGDLNSNNPVVVFYKHSLQVSEQLGIPIAQGTQDIVRSILFDAERITQQAETGEMQVSSEDELGKHFFDLDIAGTISLTLALFDSKDIDRDLRLLTPLGQATRIFYNLRDFQEDIQANLCNITKEEMAQFGITRDGLSAVKQISDIAHYPKPVQNWMRSQIQIGRRLLQAHRENLATVRFSRFARATLYYVYEKPSQNCFDRTEQRFDPVK